MGYKRKVKSHPLTDPWAYKSKIKLHPLVKEIIEKYGDRRKPREVETETEKVQTGNSGALSSKKSLFFHDIPPELLKRIAKRYTGGHIKYSPEITMNLNWRQGLTDPLYVMDRFNHLFEHLVDFLENGNEKDDNLAAIAWCCGFMMEVERVAPALINQVIGQCRYFGTGDIASSAEGKKHDLQTIQVIPTLEGSIKGTR